jgi:type I restriction enzyme R subunit
VEKQFGRRPVIFYTNGYEHRIWDDAGGYPPRETQGFYTRDELELLIQRRQTKLPLSSAQANTDIAGRPYQVRAIKAVGEAFDRKQREALLVMATGSGKTRTTIALVDLLQKANWVKRVLFLADRTALVNQAANAFKEHLPGSTTVNLVTEKAVEGRVYVSTYPTMMNLINEVDGGLRRFGPAYFDLIVIDEAHRSVYAKYGAIFDYFDSLLVGLTATPKDEVDHNTYRLFHSKTGFPLTTTPSTKPSKRAISCRQRASASAPSSCARALSTTTSPNKRRTSGTPSTGAKTDHPMRLAPRNSTGSYSTRTPSTRSSKP